MHAREAGGRARSPGGRPRRRACLPVRLPAAAVYGLPGTPKRPLATSNDAPLEAAGGRRWARRRTVSVCRRTPALLVVLMVG